jgi:hypothetical protein
LGHADEEFIAGVASGMHEEIQSASPLHCLSEDPLYLFWIGNVGGDEFPLTAEL